MSISHSDQIFCYLAPDKFLNKASLLLYTENPQNKLIGNTCQNLTRDIWSTFINNTQTTANFCNKMRLWKQLNNYIQAEFLGYALFIAGSTLNGFGLKDSDIDMSLLDKNTHNCERNIAYSRLHQFSKILKKDKNINFEIVDAIVPVIKFHERCYNLNVDINYNNINNIRNTHLLYCYSQVDWRVRPLVIIIKLWAKSQDINSARYGTLCSYSIILMVIHFLQFAVKPAVLPCLQSIFKDKFKADSNLQSMDFFEKLNIPHVLLPLNCQTLGELLIEFFKYYDTFEFERYAISVRTGTKIPKSQYELERSHCYRDVEWMWKFINVEEPFNRSNVSKSVHESHAFNKIRRAIKKTYQTLRLTDSLSSILTSFGPL